MGEACDHVGGESNQSQQAGTAGETMTLGADTGEICHILPPPLLRALPGRIP